MVTLQRAVVITGASTGIGAACVNYLHHRGFRVFAGVRKESDGQRLQADISQDVTPIILDVQDHATIATAAEFVAGQIGAKGLHGLVNNAGIAVSGPMEFVPMDDLRRQLEVNLIGQVAVTQAFMPLIRKAKGRIVNMSSMGGRVTTPYVGPYHASKYALEAISDALRMELRPWGIQVVLVEPGSIATPIWTKSKTGVDHMREVLPEDAIALYGKQYTRFAKAAVKVGSKGIPPERVAQKVAHALEARTPRTRYLVGPDAKALVTASRFLPAKWLDWVILKAMGL